MDSPSTPAAPLFALTFSHASQTARFEISNGLPDDFSSSTRLLPEHFRLIGQTATNDPAPSLRSRYRSFTATTSRSAGVSRDGTLTPPAAPLFALTFSHASQTARFEISNGLPDDFSSSTRLLPEHFRLIGQTATNDPAPSLRSRYRSFTATTSRSAGVSRDGTLTPPA